MVILPSLLRGFVYILISVVWKHALHSGVSILKSNVLFFLLYTALKLYQIFASLLDMLQSPFLTEAYTLMIIVLISGPFIDDGLRL